MMFRTPSLTYSSTPRLDQAKAAKEKGKKDYVKESVDAFLT